MRKNRIAPRVMAGQVNEIRSNQTGLLYGYDRCVNSIYENDYDLFVLLDVKKMKKYTGRIFFDYDTLTWVALPCNYTYLDSWETTDIDGGFQACLDWLISSIDALTTASIERFTGREHVYRTA